MLKSKERPIPSPSYFGPEQMGQQIHMSHSSAFRLPHTPPRASKLRECFAAEDAGLPSSPTADYLSDLRQTRPQRPSGARPPPSSKYTLRRAETDLVEAPAPTSDDRPSLPTSNSMPAMPAQKLAHRRTDSNLSKRSMCAAAPFSGRPMAREPSTSPEPAVNEQTMKPVRRTPSMSYMENGTRWMEKQETKSLRQALEDMDMKEECKIYSAAQDEAAELVWKHRNPASADPPKVFPNPDLQRDYHSHLRKGSYQRSHSRDTTSSGQRSGSDGSNKSISGNSLCQVRVSVDRPLRKVSPPTGHVTVEKRRTSKSYDQLADTVAKDIALAHRRSSSGSQRVLSGEKKMYMHPNDKIWEDPDEEEVAMQVRSAGKERQEHVSATHPQPVPSYVRKNPFARVRAQYDRMERSNSAPTLQTLPTAPVPTHDRVEIQRNAPSRSRNPWYMSNEPLPPTPPESTGHDADEVAPKSTPTKDGKEIRGDDIRAATSKTRKDYSPNLPRPTMVSNKPGRPIVSFQQQREIVLQEQHSDAPPPQSTAPNPRPSVGAVQGAAATRSQAGSSRVPVPSPRATEKRKPQIPVINVPDVPEIPSIVFPEEPDLHTSRPRPSTPIINFSPPAISINGSPADSKDHGRALPAARPLPRHAVSAPVAAGKSTPHYTPSIRQGGTLCAHCALPIAGRILSAAGERFHPGCFVCQECNTNLECVAFYPEPEKQRNERVARIRARRDGCDTLDHDDAAARPDISDGDETLRFYCHLDFHELFSPRCKSCKTPIEGEVIVACGAEWHAGHFFCAQCGDPFDSTMPFVEKDGYAWCVGCHTNRYSTKCRKCKKPVIDVVVKALGSDWHGDCFVCTECNGQFDDGRYFLRGESQDPVCVKCEERRLKA